MRLDPDNFNPFQSPDGTFKASVEKIDTTSKEGNPFQTKDGTIQIAVRFSLENNRKVTKYVSLDEEARDLTRLLKATGVTTAELEGVEVAHFMDSEFANQVFRHRTAEVTLKSVTLDDGKQIQRVYVDPLGTADAKLQAKVTALPAVAQRRPAFVTPQAQRPAPKAAPEPAPTTRPVPSRWSKQQPLTGAPAQAQPPTPERQPGEEGDDIPY